MVGYSPISSRNHRIAAAPPYHISTTANSALQSNVASCTAAGAAAATGATVSNTFHGNLSGSSRRRESMNSSIGATSIRRLLTVNRGCRHRISLHVRAKVAKNFTLLILAHGLMCAVLVPLFGLQVNKLSSFPFIRHNILWLWHFEYHSLWFPHTHTHRHQIQCGFVKRRGCCE